MGRGKKAKAEKHKKNEKPQEGEEELSRTLTELSLDPQPSTSEETTTASAEPKPAPKPEAEPESAPLPKPEEEEDETGLGLGLGKSRKKRPNKKKKAAESVSAPPQDIDKQGSGDRPPSSSLPGAPGAEAAGAAAPPSWGARPHAILGSVPAQPGFPSWQTSGPHPPQRQPVATPAFQQPQPQARAAGPTQSVRGPPQQTPSISGASTVAACGDVRKSPAESRYKIPDKVPSRNAVSGRVMRVITNYLEMTIKPLKIHRYDVTFKPDKPKKAIPKAFAIAKTKLGIKQSLAFDQMKNCYCLKPLPLPKGDRISTVVDVVDNNGRNMTFEVSFKETGIVDIGTIINHMKSGGSTLNPPTEAIQCIDVVLRQGTLENYIKAGRQFFKRPNRPINLGDGLEMWTGLFQSAIFTNRAFINIDVAHKGFPKQQSMINALINDFKLDPNNPIDKRGRNFDAFMQFIKGLRVMASIGGDSSASGQKREFICNELVDPPGKLSFTMTNAQGRQTTMTVLDYFRNEKNVRLRYPNLNCMWVGVKDKKIYYPMELLEISYGQALNKQLNEMQLSTMVREAATPPDERKRKIDEVIADMNYSQNRYFKEFGLDINSTFFEVEAKVLDAPNLDIGGNKTVTPQKGAWQAQRLLKPEALEAWAFIAIEMDMNQSNGESVIQLLVSTGRQMGMSVREPLDRFYNTPMRSLRETLYRALTKHCKFVVIIVPTRGRDYYHKVKQIAERDVGVLTQCIKEYTATRRMNQQTARNILLKVNSKMMGINQALDRHSVPACLGGGVMVVGADVTHPSPDQSSVPSIAAVTASIDPKCFFSYNIQLSIQTPKKEMIVEFEDMMVEHLKVYMSKTGALPRKIFVFRDGVSEGQFSQVMNSELQAVHRAYQRMSGDPQKRPEVLFLLVQKRHHTRFFHKDPRQAQYNVAPGTVVDREIVHPKELDFYLVSHQAIKGTARPTRYHAVCNDGKIPHDEVEQLTFYLCHLYSRCMRSVSYPTPTYYAHLACLRARSLTYGEKFNNQELERNPKRLNVLDKMLDFSRMFFV